MSLQKPFPAAKSSQLPHGVEIQPRRFAFEDLESIPQYWFAGNPLITHFENAFSIMIPPGERFFIKSVRNFEHRAEDDETRDLIRAFVQQEGLHGSAHQDYNASLARFGIDVDREIQTADKVMRRMEKILPKKIQLGVTAFLEHLTATGAGSVFTEPMVEDWMDPQMFRFWRWHAVEELEHKSVAFDLFQKVGGGYVLRMLSAFLAIAILTVPFIQMARRMIQQDPTPITREMRRQARDINRIIGPTQLRLIRQYFRPSFHPWQIDDRPHLKAWYATPEGA